MKLHNTKDMLLDAQAKHYAVPAFNIHNLETLSTVVETAEGVFRVVVPKIACKNPVGSGDSFVAGFAVALAQKKQATDCLRLAAACGTANAMEEESGFVNPETVKSLLPKIEVTRL